jgi:hypothetical protein
MPQIRAPKGRAWPIGRSPSRLHRGPEDVTSQRVLDLCPQDQPQPRTRDRYQRAGFSYCNGWTSPGRAPGNVTADALPPTPPSCARGAQRREKGRPQGLAPSTGRTSTAARQFLKFAFHAGAAAWSPLCWTPLPRRQGAAPPRLYLAHHEEIERLLAARQQPREYALL